MAGARRRFPDRVLSPYVLAIYATRCGGRDQAVNLLSEALDRHDPQAVLFARDPSFAALRNHAHWPLLLHLVGL